MLASAKAMATLAVKDLGKARTFYEEKLGLRPQNADTREATYATGGAILLLYRSDHAGTNRATAVTWNLGTTLDETVTALAQKGVTFEHYNLPNLKREGDVHVAGDVRLAWFKDLDGNIHALMNR